MLEIIIGWFFGIRPNVRGTVMNDGRDLSSIAFDISRDRFAMAPSKISRQI